MEEILVEKQATSLPQPSGKPPKSTLKHMLNDIKRLYTNIISASGQLRRPGGVSQIEAENIRKRNENRVTVLARLLNDDNRRKLAQLRSQVAALELKEIAVELEEYERVCGLVEITDPWPERSPQPSGAT